MQPVYKVIIAGTRTFNDYEILKKYLDHQLRNKATTHRICIISGCAKGPDQLGIRYAIEKGYQVLKYPADWNKYGLAAGPIRNTQMINNADAVIVFYDGKSKGTQDTINKAILKKLPMIVNYYKQLDSGYDIQSKLYKSYLTKKGGE